MLLRSMTGVKTHFRILVIAVWTVLLLYKIRSLELNPKKSLSDYSLAQDLPYTDVRNESYQEKKRTNVNPCLVLRPPTIDTHADRWQPIVNNDSISFVFAAFYDDREGSHGVLRIIGTSYNNEKVAKFCQLWYKGWHDVKTVEIERQATVTNPVRFIRYEPVQFVCKMPKLGMPYAVSIVVRECEDAENVLVVHDSSQDPGNVTTFGYCVETPLYGNVKIQRLVETFETNRLFGVSKIVLYNYSADSEILSQLQKYMDSGILELVQWDVPRVAIQRALHYYGQQASMNDCLYRLMGKVKYIAITDVDELIVPRNAPNWADMLQMLPTYSQRGRKNVAYYFHQAMFPIYKNRKENTTSMRSGLISTDRLIRFPITQSGREKYIVEARYVEYTGVHIVFKLLGNSSGITVDPSIALLHHYRFWDKKLNQKSLHKDVHMLRFKDVLMKRVRAISTTLI